MTLLLMSCGYWMIGNVRLNGYEFEREVGAAS